MKWGRDARQGAYVQRVVALVLIILAGMISLPAGGRADLSSLPYRLVPGMTSSVGVDLRSLAASEALIVWEDSRDGHPELYAYDLDDSREFRPLTTQAHRRQPDVDGSRIVWVEGADPDASTVHTIDLADRNETQLSTASGRVASPGISGDLTAWQERRDRQWVIRVRKLGAEEAETLGTDAVNNGEPSVSGDLIAWQAYDGVSWNIRVYDARTGTTTELSDSDADDENPVMQGQHIVFTRTAADGGAPQLILADVEGGPERVLAEGHYLQRPAIHQNLVVWEDWRSGLPDIYAHDLDHDESFAVARSQQAQTPVVSDDVIAWISGDNPNSQRVQMLEVEQRLPTDPQEPPAVPTPDRLYVEETEHFVSSGFKSFWQAHGGPQLLGFPLTEEFTEVDEQTGEELTVQYFERAKMEFHPDAAEGNQIQLARLGEELQPDPESINEAPFDEHEDGRYFEATGHGIRGEFQQFWEDNGGLGLFGYPITGEFVENGRTVQYFERARFEFYPESDGSRVQLGLIGREALQDRGWLPPPPVDTTRIFE